MIELTLRQEVEITRRLLGFHDIGLVAREPNVTAALMRLHTRSTTPGGGDVAGLGFFGSDGKGVHASDGSWSMPWRRMVVIAQAGLTPGNLAGYTEAAERWQHLHDVESWWVPHVPNYSEPKFLAQLNAVNDPLAYELLWWPEYLRVTDLMDAVLLDVTATAYDVLTTEALADVQLELALS